MTYVQTPIKYTQSTTTATPMQLANCAMNATDAELARWIVRETVLDARRAFMRELLWRTTELAERSSRERPWIDNWTVIADYEPWWEVVRP